MGYFEKLSPYNPQLNPPIERIRRNDRLTKVSYHFDFNQARCFLSMSAIKKASSRA
ncbi:hypothetical protein HpDR96b_12860 [Helicobacter pylori]